MQRFGGQRFGIPRQTPKPKGQSQFQQLRATELYCSQCKRAMPVRERLLLVLPEGEKYEYLCVGCGSSLGDRIVKEQQEPILIVQE